MTWWIIGGLLLLGLCLLGLLVWLLKTESDLEKRDK